MAHYFESGFMGEGKAAWHGLGTVIEGNATKGEAIKLAGLDWNTDMVPVVCGIHPMKNKFFTTRSDTGKPLGIVSDRYTTFNNSELFDLAESVLDVDTSDEACWHTAGSLKGDTQTWALLKIGELFPLREESEKIEEYMLLTTSHDGSMPVSIVMTDVRVVCSNTQALALQGVDRVFKIRHSRNLEYRLQDARAALDTARVYGQNLLQFTESLMSQTAGNEDMQSMVDKLFPIDSDVMSDIQITRAKNKRYQMWSTWKTSDNLDNVRFTKHGLLQAAIEWSDHRSTSRGADRVSRNENRMLNIVKGADVVERAKDFVLALS